MVPGAGDLLAGARHGGEAELVQVVQDPIVQVRGHAPQAANLHTLNSLKLKISQRTFAKFHSAQIIPLLGSSLGLLLVECA